MSVIFAYEYSSGNFIALAADISEIIFKSKQRHGLNEYIKNPTRSNIYYSLKPIPGFDPVTKPYIFVKDSKAILVIDVEQKVVKKLVDCIYEPDVKECDPMDICVGKSLDDVVIYTFEFQKH